MRTSWRSGRSLCFRPSAGSRPATARLTQLD
ncbi:hypothetical protein L915_08607 [Phytophthora nicotianae]|uniref:Uncharacterized protein n=1 Tax=Phytophthora nicotianae TaxID=4792 RepID=W2GUZ8_PHYNI|nr:hypothetical protein L915_08607 [Phytophthora nicotianae]